MNEISEGKHILTQTQRQSETHRGLLPLSFIGIAGGGMLAGAVEVWLGYLSAASLTFRELALASTTPILLLGLCGIVIGTVLFVLLHFVTAKQAFSTKLILCSVPSILAFWIYSTTLALVVLLSTIALALFTYWKRSHSALSALAAWLGIVFSLHPLFMGQSMELVFTPFQTLLLFTLCLFPIFLLLRFIMTAYIDEKRNAIALAILSCAFGSLFALGLAFLSSVFLVRLWGFNTMTYLQVVVLVLEVILFGMSTRYLAGKLPYKFLHVAMAALTIFLLGGFVLSSSTIFKRDFKRDRVAKFILEKLPHTGLLLSTLANAVDRDNDHYSALFGYGDCDDTNPRINPGALDIPLNGIDENCIAGDLRAIRHDYFSMAPDVKFPDPNLAHKKRKIAVFFVVDTLRADALDYGKRNTKTPILGKIARESLRFNEVYAQANHTMESFPFMLQLGFRRLPNAVPAWSLASILRAGNVKTAAIFQSSVDRWWREQLGQHYFAFDKVIRPEKSIRSFSLKRVTEIAQELLKEEGKEDLFLFIHLESLHDAATQYGTEGTRMIDHGLNLGDLVSLFSIDFFVKLMRERYQHVLSKIDHSIAPLWNTLKELEEQNDVLFLFTSDHGEEFYEHGGLFHMSSLYQETVRVPLLIYQSKKEPREVDTPIGLYRIPSTILDFLGFTGSYIEKFTLLQQIKPQDIFAAFSLHLEYHKKIVAIVHRNMKLIFNWQTGRKLLFDLKKDPGERQDVFANPAYKKEQALIMERMDVTLFYLLYGDLEIAKAMQRRAKKAKPSAH